MDAQAAAECSEPQRHGVAAPPPPTVEPALVVVKGVLAPHPAPIALTGPDAEPAAKRRAVRPEHEPCPPLPVLLVPVPAAQLHGQATSDLATACAKVAPPLPPPRHSPPALKKAIKTIKIYGWYSGPCLGATVGQVWNS